MSGPRAAWWSSWGRLFSRWDERERAERDRTRQVADDVLAAVTDPLVRLVLAHHGPVFEVDSGAVCAGCDTDEEPGDRPLWPCSTWALVAWTVTDPHRPGR